jgi:peptidoglycan/xylan/chitin deacetylase (PgdA/CDA1 family)
MGKVLIYLWFDVEDYVTPEADEPPKKIIEILSSHNVKATFKIVAEKVRALKERGREDVIRTVDIPRSTSTCLTRT